MSFRNAFIYMLQGQKVKLPHWEGYWCWENGTIMMHCADGRVLDIRQTDDMLFTMSNVASCDWEVVS